MTMMTFIDEKHLSGQLPQKLNRMDELLKDELSSIDGVYTSLKPVVMISMSLGIMPMTPVTASNSGQLTFKWNTAQTVFSMAFFACLTVASLAAAYVHTAREIESWNIKYLAIVLRESVFYGYCAASIMFLLKTCQRLPDLLRQWDVAANRLRKYVRVIETANSGSCRLHVSTASVLLVSIIFVASAAVEHVLHVIHGECVDFETTLFTCTEHFTMDTNQTLTANVAGLVFNVFANIAWNFPDLLLVLLSMALRANFRVIAEYLRVTSASQKSDQEWRELRYAHYCLVGIVQDLEEALSLTLFLSYAVNVYFLCIQTYFALRPTPTMTIMIGYYFYASLFHQLLRLSAVSFAAASFNDEATEPIHYLHRCQSSSYCDEVHRFIGQISLAPAVFTGYSCFTIDRQLFLTIISVILTYELILMTM